MEDWNSGDTDLNERIANYGLSAAGGLSRQENILMQGALMTEGNELEVAKNVLHKMKRRRYHEERKTII